MRSVVERYQTDAEFRGLVDILASQIYAARYTPTEIREAAIMAAMIVESRTIRPMYIPLRELDDLRPRSIKSDVGDEAPNHQTTKPQTTKGSNR